MESAQGGAKRSPVSAFALGVAAAVFAPFVILAPDGVWHSLSVQLSRPLQVESLGSALLLVGHHVFGLGVTGETSHGSQNLAGHAADWLAVISTVLQAGVLISIWVGVRTRTGRRRSARSLDRGRPLRVHRFRQGAVAAVPDLADPASCRSCAADAGSERARSWAVALVLTQIWFPFRYFRLSLDFEAGLSWVLLARDLTLVALVAVLVVSLRRTTATRPESP